MPGSENLCYIVLQGSYCIAPWKVPLSGSFSGSFVISRTTSCPGISYEALTKYIESVLTDSAHEAQPAVTS